MQKNQDGLGAIQGMLLIVIIAIIGFTGWYVYASANKTNKTLDQSSNQKAASKNKSVSQSSGTIIKLPKMGVQFTVPNNLKSLTFIEASSKINPDTQSGYGSESYPFTFFSLPSIETPSCQLTSQGGLLGSLWKIPGQYPKDANTENSAGTLAKQFTNYYVGYSKPAMNCSDDASLNTQIANLQTELNTALKSSTEIK